MSSVGRFLCLPKQNLLKGAGAEDGLRQRTDLAAGNNILVVVAEMRRAIIFECYFSAVRLFMIVGFSYHFFMPIITNLFLKINEKEFLQ